MTIKPISRTRTRKDDCRNHAAPINGRTRKSHMTGPTEDNDEHKDRNEENPKNG